jgi:hypothetical protein
MIRGQRDNHYNSILSSLSRYYELPDEESGSTAGVMRLKSKSITSAAIGRAALQRSPSGIDDLCCRDH